MRARMRARARVGWCPTVCSQGTSVHNHIVSGECQLGARLDRYRLLADAPIGSSYATMQTYLLPIRLCYAIINHSVRHINITLIILSLYYYIDRN